MLKQNNSLILALVVFFDFIFLISAYILARFLVLQDIISWSISEIIVSGIILIILFIALEKFEFSHEYRFKPFYDTVKKIVTFELFLLSIFYLTIIFNIYPFNNKFVFYYAAICFIVFMMERFFINYLLRLFRRKGVNFRRFLVIGAGEVGLNFYRMITSSKELGIKIIGFLDDDMELINSTNPLYTDKIKSLILGNTDKIETILKTKMVDNIIIALPMNAVEKILHIMNQCEKYGVKTELIPRYFKIISDNPSVRKIKNFTLIGVRDVPLENLFARFIKRLLDIGGSLVALILLAPLFIIVAIIIKTQSKGPVFFKQKRTGYNQKDFYIYKFRTMKVSADADTKQATKDDPRKTRIGSFLRKTNIDEFPQLINILKGEMSLVGPRPHMIAHTEEFHKKYDKYLVRHWVKPGLTGWAQVNGWRGQSDIGMRTKYDIEYIENWSLFLDVKIVFLTVFGNKVKRNAY